ncbi:MAG: AAA family ATPase [Proteobacteria bacterium]|nr:AAA family ATPase [Pseudomonadota bacterium]MBU1387898.1 AAA family ATPase [Pseudomonadota bacterium]MBU1544344.1 AAA family ATPase [Pseudomonadota bacterium]
MITRIEATNYRCLEKADVDLSEYIVLVGSNGAGKTTLLDIPDLISECLQSPSVGQAFTLSHKGRPPRCFFLEGLLFQGHGTHFSIAIEARLPEHVIEALVPALSSADQQNSDKWWRFIRYEIRFEIFNKRELTISDEHLFLFSEKDAPERGGIRIFGEYPQKSWRTIIKRTPGEKSSIRVETQKNAKSKTLSITQSILALPKVKFESADDFPAASWFYDLLCEKSVFYRPDLYSLQTASPPGLSERIIPNAANLPWLALTLQKNESRYRLWIDHVKTALPQVENIFVKEREEDHHAYFIVLYQGGYEVTSSGLSEGTLRILALTIIPYLDNLPSLIITEEPESGIHPRAIESVLQSLSSVYGSQVLVSSQSPVVLAQSELDKILCARLSDNGAASIVKGIDHPQLKEWRGQIDLGALFAAGVLG